MWTVLDSPWPFRIVWLALPLVAGPGLVAALDDASTPVQVVAGTLLWLFWGSGVVAALVPRTVSLTVLRITAPSLLVASLWAAGTEPRALTVLAVAGSSLTAAVLFVVPAVADGFVDGSSYGPERRLCLRVPAALLFGPAELAWAAVAGGLAAGPLLLAARQWIMGGVLVAVGVGLVPAGFRSMHQLSRRWVVFVPAGLVLHDPVAMSDPLLVPKRLVAGVGPAVDGSEVGATDVSAGAPGLVLELTLREAVTVPIRVRGRREDRTVSADRLLFVAARPGALLAEARRRGLPISSSLPPSAS